MNRLFIEARYKGKIKVNSEDIVNLPSKLGLVSTVQFIGILDDIKKQLKSKEIIVGKDLQKYPGQILGCDVSSASKITDRVDAFLYVGTGYFHPIALALLGKEVFVLNPFSGRINILDKKDVENYEKMRKSAKLKFLNADNIGVLISTKSGQNYPLNKLSFLEKKG